MAPRPEDDLLPWAQEVRGVETLQADSALLEQIREFLQGHEAESARDATHVVLENFPDWWVRGRRAPPGLDVQRPEDLKKLFKHAGTLFSLGIPLTLAERRTTAFRFFQDVEAWGTRDKALPFEELVGPETALVELIGTVMGETFPKHPGFLDAAVYDASGLSQTKGVRKTSLRLVWPAVVVDSERAARVRDLLVHRLSTVTKEGGPLADLEAKMLALSSSNAWHSVFGDAAYAGRASVRMPLCDRVSPLPLRAPEHRPLVPVGVMRFSFTTSASKNGNNGPRKMQVEWLCRQAELDDSEWINIGRVRQEDEAELSEWSVPQWQGNQPVPPSSTRSGRVKIRTAGGSDGGGGLRLRSTKIGAPPPERAGQLLTIERRFGGDPDRFCEQMEQHLGKATVEPDGAFVWKQPGGDARIMMYSEDKRVRVVGRPNQVRSLVVIVAPFTEAQPGLGPGMGAVGSAGHPGPLPDGRAPSDAFAPIGNGLAGAEGEKGKAKTARPWCEGDEPAGKAEENGNGQGGSAASVAVDTTSQNNEKKNNEQTASALVDRPMRRIACEAFESQGQGELALAKGEAVEVTHDPEAELGSGQDRWVYGRGEASGNCGWFPLSHTVPADEWQEE